MTWYISCGRVACLTQRGWYTLKEKEMVYDVGVISSAKEANKSYSRGPLDARTFPNRENVGITKIGGPPLLSGSLSVSVVLRTDNHHLLALSTVYGRRF